MEERFGRYVLLERIAVGGMAEIFRAKAPGLGGFEKILAIKRLHPRYSQDEDFIKMLIDEARITVELSHSNIGQIFDLGSVDDHYFIAMEFIDGRDLYRVLKVLRDKQMVMPIDVAAYIGHEACAGLDFAHRKKDGNGRPLNIVHRDVSPQNVLVSYDGEVKLVDFGIAKAALRAYETEAGIIKGKFYYMSPEQARGEVLDHRTDIFSIGIVLYECVTGELLYKDDDDVTLLSQVRRADIKPPSLIRPEIPDRLERIILRALSRDREDRYPSAQHMQRDLARFLRGYEASFNRSKLARFMGALYGSEISASIDSMGESDFMQAEDSAIGVASFDEEELTRTEGQVGSTDSSLMELDSAMIEYVDDSESDITAAPLSAVMDPSVQTMNEDVDSEDFFEDAPTMAFEKPEEYEQPPPSVVIENPHPSQPNRVIPSLNSADERMDGAADADFNEQPTSMIDEAEFARPHPAEQEVAPVASSQRPAPSQAGQRRPGWHVHREWIYIGLILVLVGVAAAFITRHFAGKDKPTRSKSRTTAGAAGKPSKTRDQTRNKPTPTANRQQGVLIVESSPGGARVEIDNQPSASPVTPTRDAIPAGQNVRVRVSKAGHKDYVTELSLLDGETRTIRAELEPFFATIEINARPVGSRSGSDFSTFAAEVRVNGQLVGKTPHTQPNLQIPGVYQVKVTKEGFEDYETIERFDADSTVRSASVTAVMKPIPLPRDSEARKSENTSRQRARTSKPRKSRKNRRQQRSQRKTSKRTRASRGRSGSTRSGGRGKLNVSTKPWASVWVDDRMVKDESPVFEYPLSAGRHQVRVCFLGNRRNCQTKRVTIRANKTETLRFNGRR